MFVELLVEFDHAVDVGWVARMDELAEGKTRGGLDIRGEVFVLKKRARPVDNIVAATFKVATPVEGTFVKFAAARDY